MGWVRDHTGAAATATAQAQTLTLGAVDVGDSVVAHFYRKNTGDKLASVTCNQGDAVVLLLEGSATNRSANSDAHGAAIIYFPTGASAGKTVTGTWTNGSAFNFFAAIGTEYTGQWVIDKTASSANDVVSTAVASGATAATTANGLVLGIILHQLETTTFTAAASWTARGSITSAGAHVELVIEDRAGVSGNIYNAQGTLNASQNWQSVAVALKAPAVNTFIPQIPAYIVA